MTLVAAIVLMAAVAVACTGDDEPSPTASPSPSPTLSATASPTPTTETSDTLPPEEAAPAIAPNGRTPDLELNTLIERLLTDDAATLERRHGDVEAREHDDDTGEDHVWTASEWTSRLAEGRRSLYAVLTAHPQTFPHDSDIVLALNVDGRFEGWRFAVDGGEVVEVVILDQPSTVSVTGAYERFLVLPPVEDLPRPPTGYPFRFDIPGTGDAEVDMLVGLVAARDLADLTAAVAYDGAMLPVQQCGGNREPRDAAYLERWLGTLAEQAYSLRAVAKVPEGNVPAAEHLLVVVRETGPYDWEEAGLLEADGQIVGLLTGCVRYPPRAFIAAPPPGGVGELDAGRRSGVDALDAVLDALAAKDRAALLELVDYGEIGCVTVQDGIGAPPLCRDGEAEGELVQVLPTAGCEGSYTRRDGVRAVIDNLLEMNWVLYAAVDRGEPIGSGLFNRGHTSAVLAPAAADPARGAVTLNLTEHGTASYQSGCGQESPEAQLARIGGSPDLAADFLLARPAARSALWLIEVESGSRTVLYEGDGQVSGRFDADGQAVSALLHLEDDRYRSVRYDLDGEVIEEYDDRARITVSPDGASRFYRLLEPLSPDATSLMLEHDGEPVPFDDAERGTYGVAFSPDGARLLIGSGELASPSEVVFTYHVISVESGESLFTFESREREGTDGGEAPRWSPSGRYVASSGRLDGLVVHDTETGESIHLGSGLSRWSPEEDAILALDDAGNVDLVRFPGERRVRLATAPGNAPRFDQTGRYAYWEDPTRTTTTIVDTATGDAVAMLDGRPADALYAGVSSVVAPPQGAAVALSVLNEDCRGVEVRPLDDGTARCLDHGAVPRWSPDGRLLAYASSDELRVLDPASGEERVLSRGIDPADYTEGALARWSPDGAYLLVQWPSGGIGWGEE